MQTRADIEFEVRWLPFQLNPSASEQPSSKLQAYMRKFGRSREQVLSMAVGMKNTFAAVDLPFNFSDRSLVSNTFQAHRVLTAAYQQGGAAAQDKAVEVLFHAYFAEERAPNDPEVLRAAAEAAGLDGAALLADPMVGAAETKEELDIGRQLQVQGVPHFIVRKDGARGARQLSGAQPPDEFLQAFADVLSR